MVCSEVGEHISLREKPPGLFKNKLLHVNVSLYIFILVFLNKKIFYNTSVLKKKLKYIFLICRQINNWQLNVKWNEKLLSKKNQKFVS